MAFFGEGKVSFYYLSSNIFYLFFIVFIVFLIKKQFKNEWQLFVALFFLVTDYNRTTLIVPHILLLTMPNIIDKKNTWLKVWFLSSFIHGLYYPVFGAGVCLGFMPMVIWQILTYAKSGELKVDIKKPKFWILWGMCFVPVFCGIPYLLGTLKHMLAMGGQTIYADGMTRFGQTVDEDFMAYIQSMPIKVIIFDLLTYMSIICIIWVSVALFLKIGDVKIENKRIIIGNPKGGLIALSVALMVLVSISYTVVRLDICTIYSRSNGIVSAAFVVLILLVTRYLTGGNRSKVFCFAIIIIALDAGVGFHNIGFYSIDSSGTLEAFYTVPDNYIHIEKSPFTRLGDSFVEKSYYETVENASISMLSQDKDDSYLGVVPYFGLFYTLDIKGDADMEIDWTIRGYGAAQETVDIVRKNGTIVGTNLNAVDNYYLYHWLLTSGEYVWNADKWSFVPNKENLTQEEVLNINKESFISVDNYDLGRTASSWGSSMDSLEKIFKEITFNYSVDASKGYSNVDFEEPIKGKDADFIYLEFMNVLGNYNYVFLDHHQDVEQDVDKYWYAKPFMIKNYNPGMKVVITITDDIGEEHSMTCRMDEGKLLIPIGACSGWLFDTHSSFKVTVIQDDSVIEMPQIKKIRLLKIREVQ